jgi:hypothetical protein
MDAVDVYLSPLGLAAALGWNFAVLASVQLTVRLIRAFSLRATVLAALLLTTATVPLTLVYNLVLRNALGWLPALMLVTGAVGFLIAGRVLRFRRRRSTVVAAIGIALLSSPWGAFLLRPP